jgi:hypothetical protein
MLEFSKNPIVKEPKLGQEEKKAMTPTEIIPFPEKDDRDSGYRTSKVGIGVIPIVGGAVQEILEMAVGLPSEKRRVEWFMCGILKFIGSQKRLDHWESRHG